MRLGRAGAVVVLLVYGLNVAGIGAMSIGLWADGLWAPAISLTVGCVSMAVAGVYLFQAGYRRGFHEGPVKVVVVESASHYASQTANGRQPQVGR